MTNEDCLSMALAMDSVCEGEKWDWDLEPLDMTPYKVFRTQIKSVLGLSDEEAALVEKEVTSWEEEEALFGELYPDEGKLWHEYTTGLGMSENKELLK